jgi:O-antigen/teichoic acid export membrane protein
LNKSIDKDVNKKINVYTAQPIDVPNSSLKKVVRGTIIAIIGSIIVIPLAFIAKVILARFFTPAEFGTFSLGFSIVSIMVVISLLGLSTGSVRQIAYHRGKKNFLQVQGIITSSLQISIISSIILALIVILTSDFLSETIFHDPTLSLPLKIFAISIPFITIHNVLISIYIGFDRIEEQVYFENILRNLLFALLLLPVVFFSFSFHYAIMVFLFSYVLTLIVFVIYTKKRLPFSLIRRKGIHPISPIYKDLLLFSIPLLSIALFQTLLTWTDTVMLGMMRTLDEVGLYNAAKPIADFINITFGALLIVFAPIITGLYAKEAFSEIRRNYYVLTKWAFLTSIPFFLIIFLFPQIFLSFLFGNDYVLASSALQVLAVGWLITNFLGPNGTILVAIGQTKFLMWACIAAAAMNIILNVLLIPPMGIIGASIATAISINFHCIIRQMKVYSILKINPISKNYLKPTIISISLILIIWYLIGSYLIVTYWMLPLIFIFIVIVIFLSVLFTRSLEQEDIMMFLDIEKRIGINLAPIKKLLGKFL